MFVSNKSPYSPFFTSGLLSHSLLDGLRRGCLPSTDALSCHPQYRSFLSLDLAESQSMYKEPTPSRESLRSIPSPKPAPSITLPEPPKYSPESPPPRLPSIVPIPPLELPAPSLTISRTPAPLTNIRRISVATKAASTVSTRFRRLNRSEALACLEGRSKHRPVYTKHAQPQHRNFIYMSDDEDEDSDLDSPDFDDYNKFLNPVLEPEDVVLPTSSFLQVPMSAPPSSLPRHKNDWLPPLKSFIDLHNDDDSSSWAWRSFIQVANVS